MDEEEIEATRKMQSSTETAEKTADETENEIEKIIQFMIEDNYNISFISSIRSLMALYKTYLSLYNKEKEKNKELIEGQTKTLEKLLIPELLKNYISKDKIKEKIKKEMKYLYVDSCAEDSGKYSAYMSILNFLKEDE